MSQVQLTPQHPTVTVLDATSTALSVDLISTYRATISEFLRRANIPMHALQPASKADVMAGVLEETKGWTERGLLPIRWQPYVEASLDIATITYGHTRPDVQVHITLFTTLTIAIDEFEVSDDDLDAFSSRLLSNSPQSDPLLDCLVDNLRRMTEFFPAYSSKCITLSTIEFIDATLQDKYSVGVDLRPGALSYVNYKRFRNGLGAAYGFFIWDKFSFPDVFAFVQIIPAAAIYLCFTNDILSFYKEQIAGEKDNYLHNRAAVSNKDVNDVLKEVIDEVVIAVDKARPVLTGEKEKDVWEKFLMGYAAFHYMTPRYKLKDLLPEESVLC
ncbi:isoprenoid synthase domain-containing protein [Irpex rosettiformis]|uniref:Isoprenoid synthase domain-containing protein n=1 Tax=Irpex rosettiformis TaxID=378272 RepID=A0ACB8U8K5_9APHY|nr:isoprenoid synthase domain-containing protein [Irpex rosettiformis]